jgi:uncharacterized protein YdcH (DUF465 family)
MTATVKSDQLDRKIRAVTRAAQAGQQAGIEELGKLAVELLVDLSPRDTNRYVNGWIIAGIGARVSRIAPYMVKQSSRHQQYLDALAEQVATLERLVRLDTTRLDSARRQDATAPPRLDGKPRARRVNQPWFRQTQSRLMEREKRLKRARKQLKDALGADSFLFFGADAVAERGNKRKLSTIRTKEYGGKGRRVMTDAGVLLELINLEPHVRIVEKHPHLGHPVATTRALLRAVGAGRAIAAYKKALRAA